MIIKTAAEPIKSEIKTLATSRASYPCQDDTASRTDSLDFVPDSLQLTLTTIFNRNDVDLKVASIGQAITQAARPRILICPTGSPDSAPSSWWTLCAHSASARHITRS